MWAGATPKGYWAPKARPVPEPRRRLDRRAYARRHDYPREDYFGLGPDSLRRNQTDFTLRSNTFGGRAGVRPYRDRRRIGGGLEYIAASRRQRHRRSAALDRRRVRRRARRRGCRGTPTSCGSSAFVEVDWRRPLNARKGGWYRAEFSHYDDRDLGAYSFNRLDVDLRQFVSFLSERRVLVGRGRGVDLGREADGRQVPFYLMPTLGGNDTLARLPRLSLPRAARAAAAGRVSLRDLVGPRRRALFYDAGKVAMRRSDLDFSNLESDYGFGFRFNTDNGIVVRVDAGVRESRWQASLDRLWRHVLGGAATFRPARGAAAVVAAVSAIGACTRPRHASIPTIRCGRTTMRRSMRRRVVADRGRQQLRLRRQHVRRRRASARRPRAERQHARRSARLELVHQSHRSHAECRPPTSCAARIALRRSRSTAGWCRAASARACSPDSA